MKIVLIGDSLIYGYGVPYGKGWAHIYDAQTKDTVINKGTNGNSTYEMINRYEEDVIANKPDYVFIMGGSNDLVFSIADVKTILENIKQMIKIAKENNIKPIIGIPPMADHEMASNAWSDGVDYNKMNKDLEEIKKIIQKIGKEEQIPVIDFNTKLGKIINETNKESYLIDGLHPTQKGQEEMYKIFKEAIRDV